MVMIYEGLILFALCFMVGSIFDISTNSRHALYLRHAREAVLFVAIGIYFIYFWVRNGQTLPMQTWRIKLLGADGSPVRPRQALLRYLFAWMWFLPAIGLGHALGLKIPLTLALLAIWMVLWACAVWLDPQRQFLHDRRAGTRLVTAAAAPLPARAREQE
ncbi:MAG: hypothetical protein RL748_2670 [Pseudomonadota bacterium]